MQYLISCVIAGFDREENNKCSILGYLAAQSPRRAQFSSVYLLSFLKFSLSGSPSTPSAVFLFVFCCIFYSLPFFSLILLTLSFLLFCFILLPLLLLSLHFLFHGFRLTPPPLFSINLSSYCCILFSCSLLVLKYYV